MRFGSLFGVPVRVSPWCLFLVAFLFFGSRGTLSWIVAGNVLQLALVLLFLAAFTLSLLAHEFAHVLVGRRLGVETEEVVLLGFGAIARMRYEPLTPGRLFLVSAAGPAMNAFIALSLVVAGFLAERDQVRAFLVPIILGNLAMAAFNLIIAKPLDGGQMLHAVLWKMSGDRVGAERACHWVAVAIAPVLTGAGMYWRDPIVIIVGMGISLNGFLCLQKTPVPSA